MKAARMVNSVPAVKKERKTAEKKTAKLRDEVKVEAKIPKKPKTLMGTSTGLPLVRTETEDGPKIGRAHV